VRTKFIILNILTALILGACGGTIETPSTGVPLPTDTSVPSLPTQTATPVVPLAILIVPSTMDAESSNLYQKTVYDLTQSSGMRFQVLIP